MLKHRPIQNHYDFENRGRQCLIALPWAKIVDIAIFRFGSGLVFTTKVPFQFARAPVHDAPYHLVSFTIDLHSWSLIGVPISASLAQCISKAEVHQRARALHVHNAPQHPASCTYEKHPSNYISALNFASLGQSFPKVKAPMQIHSARA